MHENAADWGSRGGRTEGKKRRNLPPSFEVLRPLRLGPTTVLPRIVRSRLLHSGHSLSNSKPSNKTKHASVPSLRALLGQVSQSVVGSVPTGDLGFWSLERPHIHPHHHSNSLCMFHCLLCISIQLYPPLVSSISFFHSSVGEPAPTQGAALPRRQVHLSPSRPTLCSVLIRLRRFCRKNTKAQPAALSIRKDPSSSARVPT